ncbi:DUF4215 domain-containing protein [Nannocystis pusilla]|uniref:DUF4215 domain-containing protein n=1 Tax=Nannocystis pusilla TaxID=889268 RepID=UPI003BF220F2
MSFARSQVLMVVLASSGCFSPSGIDGSATSSETSAATTGTTTAPETTDASATSTSTSTSDAPTTEPTSTVTSLGTTETTTTSTTEPVTSTEPETTTIDPTPGTTTTDDTGVAVCGDGTIDPPVEECDDGNLTDGDGCSSLCTVEMPNKKKRFVFLTSASYTGLEVGSLDLADDACNALAKASQVATVKDRTYRAWLSDGGANAIDRIGSYTGEYVMVGGTPVASNSTAFETGALKGMINVTEQGTPIPWLMEACATSSDGVWTGTHVDGTADAANCNNWQADRGQGLMGAFGAVDGNWTACSPRSCDSQFRLYCIEVE